MSIMSLTPFGCAPCWVAWRGQDSGQEGSRAPGSEPVDSGSTLDRVWVAIEHAVVQGGDFKILVSARGEKSSGK